MKSWAAVLGLGLVAGMFCGCVGVGAQEVASEVKAGVVPGVVRYSGVAADAAGKRVSLRFTLYDGASGGSALWSESQTVTVDGEGKYTVLLGAGSSLGLPPGLFAAGEVRWLGVREENAEETPRTVLASVPYAMKAANAETLAGRAESDFVTHEQLQALMAGGVNVARPLTTTPVAVTGTGTPNYVPIWTSASVLGSSAISQVGTGTAAKVGIGTAAPTATLTVTGAAVVQQTLNMAIPGVATATAAVNSPLLELTGSAYNSSTSAAVPQIFGWKVLATGNNTATPSSYLAFVYGTGPPSVTGLSVSPKGIITFAAGQTFPGMTGSGGTVNATTYDLNGTRFDYGNQSNAFLAFAGGGSLGTGTSNIAVGNAALKALTSGSSNAALGFATLANNSTGSSNTAIGTLAMEFNTSGSSNTGVGGAALVYNTTGTSNTAIGEAAGPDSASPGLTGATAIGANAVVSESNALVLGHTVAGSPGATNVNVGIGTATPVSALEISKKVQDGMGPVLTLTNGGGTSTSLGYHPAMAAIDFKTYAHASTANSPTSRIAAVDDHYGNMLSLYTKTPGSDGNALKDEMDVEADTDNQGNVTIYDHLGVFLSIPVASTVPPTVAEFGGDVHIDGQLNGGISEVKIDHPLDPANKFLEHAAVASSEMVNLYSGNVTTDSLGLATVTLPEWFEAENGDFRYQLTTIGRDAHAWVAEEVGNHRFKIATNASFVKVSWQITAVRKDAYALAHPMVVEKAKTQAERGYYVHPDLYGQPAERQLRWGQHPQEMARAKARHAAYAETAAGSPAKPAK